MVAGSIPFVTFCIGYRDWYPRHLEACLKSLRAQTDLPIVIADLSINQTYYKTIDAHAARYGAVIRRTPEPTWSRSVALNRAAAGAESEHLVFTDADMIFSSAWVSTVWDLFWDTKARQGLWLTRSRDLLPAEQLPPNFVDTALIDENFLLEFSEPHPDIGQGAATIVPRDWFERVGGFDETYQIWGCEDNDIVLRAQWDHLQVQWLPNLFVYHQWHSHGVGHPQIPTLEAAGPVVEQVRRNREYLAARVSEKGPIVRNQLV
jgi:GT2 family glycosyltransferase